MGICKEIHCLSRIEVPIGEMVVGEYLSKQTVIR